MSVETSRQYWIRVLAGQVMTGLVGMPGFAPHTLADQKAQAKNAVNIAKALLDEIESGQADWITPNYPKAS